MKSLYRFLLTNLPRPWLIRFSYVFRLIAPILLKGNEVECPVCGKNFKRFLSYGSNTALRPNVLCPHCLSLERHRLLWLYLQKHTSLFEAPLKLLHVAPEQCFHERFKKLPRLEYITADLESPLAEYHFDLHQIPFDDDSFDAILCNHVLEHVADDRQCARELYRVLKPGGWAVLQVPIDYSRELTLEDPSIQSAEEREAHYWQKDHVRLFGKDYAQRLSEAGFTVEVSDFVVQIPDQLAARYRLQREERLYIGRK